MKDPERWRFFLAGMIAGVAFTCGVLAFLAAWVGSRPGRRIDST